MKIQRIHQIGERAIRAKSKVVAHPASEQNQKLVQDLVRVMCKEGLVGIAAPQIGINKRLFITQPRSTKFRSRKTKAQILVYFNPSIIKRSAATETAYEGCGSVAHAGIFGKVGRSVSVTVKAQDRRGDWFTLKATGLLARIIQHEYDHLEGVVFLDRVKDTRSLISREAYINKI